MEASRCSAGMDSHQLGEFARVELEQGRGVANATFPDIFAHLDRGGCRGCIELYVRLYDMLAFHPSSLS